MIEFDPDMFYVRFQPDLELEWKVGPDVEIEFEGVSPPDCPCPPLFKDRAYCDDCPYRENLPTDLPEPPDAA